MELYRENIKMPDSLFPVMAWVSDFKEHIFVHPHWHDEIEILYILEGEATQRINEAVFCIGKGDVVCIAGNDIHSTYGNSHSEILVIQFSTDFIMPVYALSPEKKMIEDFKGGLEPAVIKLDSDTGGSIPEILLGIYRELKNKNAGYEMFVRAKIYELIGISTRNLRRRKKGTANTFRMEKAREMLRKTFSLIDNHYGDKITLHQAAEVSNLSVSHFCRLFKKAAGMTFRNYLTLYRIGRAEELLSTALSLTEIANECGFESMSSFIRAFRHHRHTTPSAYRNTQ